LGTAPQARGRRLDGGRHREPERGGGSGVPPSAPLGRPDAGPDDSPDILAALKRRETDAHQARSILDEITARPTEGASERPRDILAAIEPKAPEGPSVLDQISAGGARLVSGAQVVDRSIWDATVRQNRRSDDLTETTQR
jgi:hypothetical protein